MKQHLKIVYSAFVPYVPERLVNFIPIVRKYFLIGRSDNFFLHDAYRARSQKVLFDDTANTDQWQREVYQFAHTVHARRRLGLVCDLGCGSGYKLVTYFKGIPTIGIDLPNTCAYLRKTYPDKEWREFDPTYIPAEPIDLLIAADVIEHLVDPDEFLNYITRLVPKYIVMSTPDRNLLGKSNYSGPPANPGHVREWSFNEFHAYIETFFQIEKHFISNAEQGTQCVLCSLRTIHT
jgi:hypothetical protein